MNEWKPDDILAYVKRKICNTFSENWIASIVKVQLQNSICVYRLNAKH